MPKLLLLLLTFSLPQLASGQAPNFFVDGSRWVYNTSESWEPNQPSTNAYTEQNMIQGDTLINGVVYGKLYTIYQSSTTIYLPWPQPPVTTTSQGQAGPSFIRFDSVQNKVFFLPNVDSTEFVIYDFNLQVGDLTPMQPSIFQAGMVDSIENVSLFGSTLKKFYTTGPEAVYEQNYILEGIGGSNGLTYFQPMYLVVSGGIFTTQLVCFQNGDNTYAPLTGECPLLELVSTKDKADESLTVLVSPNPTQGDFSVSVAEELLGANFMVTDCLGRRVQSSFLGEQVSFASLPTPGIYFWQIEKQGRLVGSGKIVVK
jgi:hypothetical protein